jgi:hypothetical protein
VSAQHGGEYVRPLYRAVVEAIEDHRTLRLAGGTVVRLARVQGPAADAPTHQQAREGLRGAALERPIFYSPLDVEADGALVAEVWTADCNLNAFMCQLMGGLPGTAGGPASDIPPSWIAL